MPIIYNFKEITQIEKGDSSDDNIKDNLWNEINLDNNILGNNILGNNICFDTENNGIDNNDIENNIEINAQCASTLNYNLNYSVKELQRILDYYEINGNKLNKKNKLNKGNMIELLIEFESEPNNREIKNKRKRLFDNINELKNNKYMKKFIMW